MSEKNKNLPEEPEFEYEDTSVGAEDQDELGPNRNLGLELNGMLFGDEDEGEGEDEDPTPAAESASLAELRQQNEQLAAQVQSLSGQFNGYQQVQAGLSELGERIGQGQGQTVQQKPGESDEEFKKRINESLYEDPYSNLEAWGQRRFGPVVQQMMDRNLQMQRQIMRLDPEKGKFFTKYEKEIDKELAAMPPQMRYNDPEVLTKVYKNVVAAHVEEIVEERLQERMGGSERQGQGQDRRRTGQTPYSGTSQTRSKQGGDGTGSTRKIPDYVREFALKRGMHESDAYAFMKENNMLRRAK